MDKSGNQSFNFARSEWQKRGSPEDKAACDDHSVTAWNALEREQTLSLRKGGGHGEEKKMKEEKEKG